MEDCLSGLKYKNLIKRSVFKGQKFYRPSDRVLTKWSTDCQNKTSKTQTMVVADKLLYSADEVQNILKKCY